MSYKGRFIPRNPEKYAGNPTRIVYRSLWELRVMRKFDADPNVLTWASEEVVVPYVNPLDNRVHRYFPDFLVKNRTRDDTIKITMIEVKPASQAAPPKHCDKKSRRKYISEAVAWQINNSKWEAARRYCSERGWTFAVLTEKSLGVG